jgi:dienelactone hydrolase
VAVRRGYIGCIYAGADTKDDTEKYSEIWAGKYDFTRLRRRAYGASRAIDYLYTLPEVDKQKIAHTGHSRNGDLSIIAAAFDERITAVIPSSGTGQEVPWRYSAIKYDIEDISLLASGQPSWYHPRLRFFYGREQKLPVDNNSFLALIAPRGLMLSSGTVEGAGNPWGSEQAYFNAMKVYKFLNAEDHLAIRHENRLHSVSARDMEDYIDFFDYVFGRSSHKPGNRLFINYSFDEWRKISTEKINPKKFDDNAGATLLSGNIRSVNDWESRKKDVQKQIRWGLGDEPAGVYNPGPGRFTRGAGDENNFGTFLIRPKPVEGMGRMPISPYNGFGDQLFGYLYYPADEKGGLKNDSLPVMIYLHEYDYSKGFNSYHQVETLLKSIVDRGYAVFVYDMIGFGNRLEEGTRFYNRYPHWSKMGKMVTDVRGAVDALSNLPFVDRTKIYVSGYSLGATVSLYAAALDPRIAGVVSVCGFTPMRTDVQGRGTEGIMAYSHLHGLLPRLGFFVGNESRLPYDFNEILACIAPRPVLVIAPLLDKDAHPEDIQKCIDDVSGVYGIYGKNRNIELFTPEDYNRFSPEMRERMYEWLSDKMNTQESVKNISQK